MLVYVNNPQQFTHAINFSDLDYYGNKTTIITDVSRNIKLMHAL